MQMVPPTDPVESSSSRANFLAFLASLFLSKIADQVLLFLVPLVVFQTTQDVGWSGLAFAAEAFPRFLSFPICGALCDRISPVRLMRWSQVLRAAICAAGAVCGQVFGGVGWLIAVSALCGVLTTQGAMAREVILPQVFKKHRFEKCLRIPRPQTSWAQFWGRWLPQSCWHGPIGKPLWGARRSSSCWPMAP
jgi:MFS family permease